MAEEQIQQIIKNLKKSNKCTYPGCPEIKTKSITMPVGQITESNQIIFPNKGQIRSLCKLCKYHTPFAEKGIINLVEINKLIQLTAPVELITLIETIFEAKEFKQAKKKGIKVKRKRKC